MYCLCNLEELQLFVDGSLICNAYDIASFIGFCPSLQRLFIDVGQFTVIIYIPNTLAADSLITFSPDAVKGVLIGRQHGLCVAPEERARKIHQRGS